MRKAYKKWAKEGEGSDKGDRATVGVDMRKKKATYPAVKPVKLTINDDFAIRSTNYVGCSRDGERLWCMPKIFFCKKTGVSGKWLDASVELEELDVIIRAMQRVRRVQSGYFKFVEKKIAADDE